MDKLRNFFNENRALKAIWVINLVLALYYVSTFYWLQFIKSSVLEYSNITSDPFDGTVYPISYVPNWLVPKNTNKALNFSDSSFTINDFVEIPKYDAGILQDDSWKNKDAIMTRYEYPVVYMWSYRLNYQEYDGSHPWVDIRAPIWTPVLSVANGVVVKVKDTESGDWKYVIIRHDNVNVWGNVETLFSAYEHLSAIVAIEWTKIKKWDVLGYVWMTWITTTPHLHFQIDKNEAPFHAYWPYTFSDATNAWLDFFSAVNVWLWKENSIQYTINPFEFINKNLSQTEALNSAPELSVSTTEIPKNLSSNPNISNPDQNNTWSIDISSLDTPIIAPAESLDVNNIKTVSLNTGNILSEKPIIPENKIIKIPRQLGSGQIFYDVSLDSKFYKSTKFLFDSWITKGYSDWNFWIDNSISRWEALIFIFKTLNIKLDSNTALDFMDIPSDSFLSPYLSKAIDLQFVAKNKYFRQNDTITRAEFVTMLIKATGKPLLKNSKQLFTDVLVSDWFFPYINTFASLYSSTSVTNFYPNSLFNRWQIALILYSIAKNN